MSGLGGGGKVPRETAMSRIVVPERQRVEEALVEAKREVEMKLASQSIEIHQLRAAIDSCSDGILIVDSVGNVKEFSRSLVKLLQIPDSALEDANQSVAFEAIGRLFEESDQIRERLDAISTSTQLESHDVIMDKQGRVVGISSFIQIADGALVGRVWNLRHVVDDGRAGPRNIA